MKLVVYAKIVFETLLLSGTMDFQIYNLNETVFCGKFGIGFFFYKVYEVDFGIYVFIQ